MAVTLPIPELFSVVGLAAGGPSGNEVSLSPGVSAPAVLPALLFLGRLFVGNHFLHAVSSFRFPFTFYQEPRQRSNEQFALYNHRAGKLVFVEYLLSLRASAHTGVAIPSLRGEM